MRLRRPPPPRLYEAPPRVAAPPGTARPAASGSASIQLSPNAGGPRRDLAQHEPRRLVGAVHAASRVVVAARVADDVAPRVDLDAAEPVASRARAHARPPARPRACSTSAPRRRARAQLRCQCARPVGTVNARGAQSSVAARVARERGEHLGEAHVVARSRRALAGPRAPRPRRPVGARAVYAVGDRAARRRRGSRRRRGGPCGTRPGRARGVPARRARCTPWSVEHAQAVREAAARANGGAIPLR